WCDCTTRVSQPLSHRALSGPRIDEIRAGAPYLRRIPEFGLRRFVTSSWSQACQPDRGHKDFDTELCR
ncbi:MAG: hypothetical protein WKF60_12505, partial [Ilumatobacter sp.]